MHNTPLADGIKRAPNDGNARRKVQFCTRSICLLSMPDNTCGDSKSTDADVLLTSATLLSSTVRSQVRPYAFASTYALAVPRNHCDHTFTVSILGAPGSGKSSLINQFRTSTQVAVLFSERLSCALCFHSYFHTHHIAADSATTSVTVQVTLHDVVILMNVVEDTFTLYEVGRLGIEEDNVVCRTTNCGWLMARQRGVTVT
jgi:hypothetical protein